MKNTDKLSEIIKKNILVNIPVSSKTGDGNSASSHSETKQGQRQTNARSPLEDDDPLRIPPRRSHGIDQPL